jgi:hypothetical protein
MPSKNKENFAVTEAESQGSWNHVHVVYVVTVLPTRCVTVRQDLLLERLSPPK